MHNCINLLCSVLSLKVQELEAALYSHPVPVTMDTMDTMVTMDTMDVMVITMETPAPHVYDDIFKVINWLNPPMKTILTFFI